MKTIHKKIISLQARAMSKAVKQIKKAFLTDEVSSTERSSAKNYYTRNNTRFLRAKQLFSGYSDTVKAHLLREIFRTDEFKFYRNSESSSKGRPWALYYHGSTYCMKQLVFAFTALRNNGVAQSELSIDTTVRYLKGVDYVPYDASGSSKKFITLEQIDESILKQNKTRKAHEQAQLILKEGTARFSTAEDLIASLESQG